MKEIFLTQGKVALVDDCDFEWLIQWKWYAHKGGNTFYAQRASPGKNGKQLTIRMHHEIIGYPPKGFMTDHWDGNGLNDQKENLRNVTYRQNGQNRKNSKKKKTSKYPGVSWHKRRKKWMARIQINGKNKNLGYFIDEKQAFEIYEKEVNRLGETVISRY